MIETSRIAATTATAHPLLTVGEFAAALRVSKESVYRWRADGRLRVVVLPSGQVRIPRSELCRILGEQP